jgi:undecaprenyl-diphosphatase
LSTYLIAALLGVIEGLTEFLPVSSTGHLILAGHFFGFQSKGKTFEVLVQLGAILAILAVYFRRLVDLLVRMGSEPRARRFVAGILIAFLPAAIIGVLLHKHIKALFEQPLWVCVALILGGLVLLAVDFVKLTPRYGHVEDYPLPLALKIGLFQCLAMFPGVSRSGATIVGATLMGSSKPAAAEFSFFLAMPTMAGAFAYDLFKNYKSLDFNDAALIGIGFVMAFLSALLVVRLFVGIVSRHGFAPFAYWRIGVGTFGLVALLMGG